MTQQTGPMPISSGTLDSKVEAWKFQSKQASHTWNLDVGGERAESQDTRGVASG